MLACTLQLPPRHQPLMAQEDLWGEAGGTHLVGSVQHVASAWLCLKLRVLGLGTHLPACGTNFSLCPAGSTAPSPFFQFSHAAEARAPQDSKETVRGCLPI